MIYWVSGTTAMHLPNNTFRPKPLERQVVVITGATSGIGLSTAMRAAANGARIMLVSRCESELVGVEADIRSRGGRAIHMAADVSDPRSLDLVGDRTLQEWGHIDTWVNNAGISIYGLLSEVSLEEQKRLFEVNFWGVVHGCRTAVRCLRASGGTIINMGSSVSERAIPLQGTYCASKHAVKAYTDALRMELEAEGAPIVVTLIKPSSIDTPFTHHAANHMDVEPRLPMPVYAPEVVADAILTCAQHPHRDVFVGGSAKALSLFETFAPRLADRYMERNFFSRQRATETPHADTTLFVSGRDEGHARGGHAGHVSTTSLYTHLTLHPLSTAFLVVALVLVCSVAALV